VWQILHECSLEDYYRLRDIYPEGRQSPARVSGKTFEYLDDPEYLRRFAEARMGGLCRVELYLEGVHCVACSWLVEKVLLERTKAHYAHLNLGKATVEIVFDPTAEQLSRIAQALDRIGYTPHPIIQNSDSAARRNEARRLVARMGIAGACAANIMLLSISQYAGDFSGIEPGYSALFRWVSLGLALPAVTYSAWPFYRGAWHGLRQRMLHMDLPISLGILAAFLVSAVATLKNRGEVFFDSVSALVFLLLAGRLMLQRAGGWAASASENLLALAPKTAKRIDADGTHEVLLTEVLVGDRLQMSPGDVIPVDGELESEIAWIKEAHLTGEPGAVKCGTGSLLYAGSTVEQIPVILRTRAVGETTRLWALAQMMRDAATRRAPITALLDRIAGHFVAGVLAVAVATAVVWYFIDPVRAPWIAAALLVVTCPCALGLATPIALAMAMGRGARRGLFVRGQDGIERLAKVQHVIFDKTGTLTEGSLRIVSATYAANLDEHEQLKIMRVVTALERYSGHAFASAFDDVDSAGCDLAGCHVTPGAGVEGFVNEVPVAAGSESFIADHVTDIPTELEIAVQDAKARGWSLIYVAYAHHLVAVLALGDALRVGVSEMMDKLRAMNLTTELLSGDHEQAVAQVADQLRVTTCRAHVTPEEKLAHVEQLEASGIRVAMVGDGVNDAAALSRATIGISVAGAADVARDAADVFIAPSRGPQAVAELFHLSRRAMRRIKWTLIIAVAYNFVGAAFAVTGHIHPLIAAILMPLSSLTVVFIATRR
jgi:Cu2+-exporting ATPase